MDSIHLPFTQNSLKNPNWVRLAPILICWSDLTPRHEIKSDSFLEMKGWRRRLLLLSEELFTFTFTRNNRNQSVNIYFLNKCGHSPFYIYCFVRVHVYQSCRHVIKTVLHCERSKITLDLVSTWDLMQTWRQHSLLLSREMFLHFLRK